MSSGLQETTPVLRFYDEPATRAFYVEWLDFHVTFEHRFEEGLPLYMGIARGDAVMHLSQHHGDATPGTHIRVRTDDVHALHAELAARPYGFARPGPPQMQPWGYLELSVTDPAGNRLTFWTNPDYLPVAA
ncbi:glyoxalase/bleomycin resistance/extradiol dioxygenase family protein [Acuticoccus sediminis]|uniref:Bleomycin resistance protein n=1 Tax=Acuticoccus sediminis TaxID=2184697 RepID=A0A8B2NYV6_9HYPH|nr:glyoxalase superfamily protein [Acuticoccus sediminis]RAI03066.1 glyoxalase/bleomycin resistance/extradiol dioxygenase family protein [Acuticoccus sediminis]